jgi:hypothetical protein
VFTQYEGIAIAAVLASATEAKPSVAMRKITQYVRDFGKDPKLVRLPTMMKKALKTLVDQNIFKAKKDSYAVTSCGRGHAQGNMVHARTASNPGHPLATVLQLF